MITLIIFSRFFQNICFRKILHFCDIEKGYLHKEIRVLFWKPFKMFFLVQVNPWKMCIKRITLKVRKKILKEEYEMRVFRFLFYKILKQSFKVWRKKWILNLLLICIYNYIVKHCLSGFQEDSILEIKLLVLISRQFLIF